MIFSLVNLAQTDKIANTTGQVIAYGTSVIYMGVFLGMMGGT